MADPQTHIQNLLDQFVERDIERGLQVAVYLDGTLVIDAWSGLADPATGRAVDGDTLFTVWSSGKGIAATVLHLLAERGLLTYDTPVAALWPEFGTHGKQTITVQHVLTHSAGIPQIPHGVTPADVLDWATMCRRIAELEVLWLPGTNMGYHTMTYGWLTGEIARRVDGRPFDQIVRQDICAHLGIRDLYFGIPDTVEPRVAHLEEAVLPVPADAPVLEVLNVLTAPPWRAPLPAWANQSAVRQACVPSSGAIMNARSLARFYAALAGSELDGVQLLPRERIKQASALCMEGPDVILGVPIRRALGYHLGGPQSAMSERVTAFGHGGAGGTLGYADPQYHLAFALTKNRMLNAPVGEDAAFVVAREVRKVLGIPEVG